MEARTPTQHSFAFTENPPTALSSALLSELGRRLNALGHRVGSVVDAQTDAIVTAHTFGDVVDWRDAPLFSARRLYGLRRSPMCWAVVHGRPEQVSAALRWLRDDLIRPDDCTGMAGFAGLNTGASRVLREQARRGGAVLALSRVLQSQVKCLRIVLAVGESRLNGAFHFDLVGSHPFTPAVPPGPFYQDMIGRLSTALDARELKAHELSDKAVPRAVWSSLTGPKAMVRASKEFDRRGLFTPMIRIADLIKVPAVSDAVAAQYSEGCFATWEPLLNAMLVTVSGSAMSADKGMITEDDLVAASAVTASGDGAVILPVEGTPVGVPSSETVEMLLIDQCLRDGRNSGPSVSHRLPVLRSKLHIHRGIRSFDERYVAFAPFPERFQRLLVSCGTDSQARAVARAFAACDALSNGADSRPLAFTVLPGHGIFIVEKWRTGKAPFELIWEHIDSGALELESRLPQGPHDYVPSGSHRRQIRLTGGNLL